MCRLRSDLASHLIRSNSVCSDMPTLAIKVYSSHRKCFRKQVVDSTYFTVRISAIILQRQKVKQIGKAKYYFGLQLSLCLTFNLLLKMTLTHIPSWNRNRREVSFNCTGHTDNFCKNTMIEINTQQHDILVGSKNLNISTSIISF